jgi:chromosome segregation ATPase
MRTELGRLEIDLARERAKTEQIESIVKKIESLNAEVDSADVEVAKLHETFDALRVEGNDVGTVRHSITEKLDSIDANKNILKELEADVEKLAAEFEANQPDRLRRIEEKEELMKRLEHNRAMTTKLNDEIFLLESDLWKSRQNMEMVKRAILVTEEEIEEVKNFSIPMEEVASREERRNALEELDEEKNRLLFEIESLRDAKFRARMRL